MNFYKISLSKVKKNNLFKILKKHKIVIVNNCFSTNKMLLAKEELINFFKIKKFRSSISKNKNLYHRWDFNPKKAKFLRIMLSATFELKDKKYFKNCIDILNIGIRLKNHYIDDYSTSLKKKKIDYYYSPRGTLYPIGGGYYQTHNDSFSDEKILDIIRISNVKDYDKGGLYIKLKNKEYEVEKNLSPGSIVLLDPSINHGIKPIDKNKKLIKNSFKGRFSLISVAYIKR